MQPADDIEKRLRVKAEALGISLPPEDREAVLAGARWLRDGLERLRREGLAP